MKMTTAMRANLAENGRRARTPEKARPARWQRKTVAALSWQLGELLSYDPIATQGRVLEVWRERDGDFSYAGYNRLIGLLEKTVAKHLDPIEEGGL